MTVAVAIARALLGIVLLAAGAAKLSDLADFERTLRAIGPNLSRLNTKLLAILVASLEVLVGLVNLAGFVPLWIDGIALCLMTGFAFVGGFALRKQRGLACRCFGALTTSTFGFSSLLRNIALLAVAAVVLGADAHLRIHYGTFAVWTPLILVLAALFGYACAEASRALAFMREGIPS